MILFVIIMMLVFSSAFRPRRYYGGYFGPMFSSRRFYSRPMPNMHMGPMPRGPRGMSHGPMGRR